MSDIANIATEDNGKAFTKAKLHFHFLVEK
jgi:hypothetical protein